MYLKKKKEEARRRECLVETCRTDESLKADQTDTVCAMYIEIINQKWLCISVFQVSHLDGYN